ncbi:MAG: hypothetical protein HOO96_20895 [Polyangiaceae bacterium]|nr:hypothetical protein [Polyangiaceae bacterium]
MSADESRKRAADAVLEALRATPTASTEAWAERFRRQMAVVNGAEQVNATGERELRVGPEVARVARELHEGMTSQTLSFGERRLYHALKSAIVSELAAGFHVSQDEATRLYEVAAAGS